MLTLTRAMVSAPRHSPLSTCSPISPRIDTVKFALDAKCSVPLANVVHPPITKPAKFCDICICDHIIAYDELSKGINGEQEAFVLVDIATGWMFGYPAKT